MERIMTSHRSAKEVFEDHRALAERGRRGLIFAGGFVLGIATIDALIGRHLSFSVVR